MTNQLPPELCVDHAAPVRMRPTARPCLGSAGAWLSGPAHGPGIETPGVAVTDASTQRGLMRQRENRGTLTTMAADAATNVSPQGSAWLPPFALPGRDAATGPAARGSRDVKGVQPPVKRRRRMFRRWGSGQ